MNGLQRNNNILFLRQQEVESNEEEDSTWNDTELIKAYDKAVFKAKQKILNKIQSEFGETEEQFSDISNTKPKKEGKIKNKKKGPKANWQVGSSCRAVYSVDGEEYEAKIIKIINPNLCTVKYIGYDNEENILIKDLMPSLGKNIVKLQIECAEEYNVAQEACSEDESDEQITSSSGKTSSEAPAEQNFATDPRLFNPPQRTPMFSESFPVPPPPPFFPFSSTTLANHTVGTSISQPSSRNESLNALLMSWYMCGYYTGFHQRDLID